ncbi:MAG TPA: hypothetical protein VFK29_10405 [Rhodanobacteraceae bacterium]|jgi:hypothetical protein|nr:hypothetical protein [Rhodanobacteraceae bacterium]
MDEKICVFEDVYNDTSARAQAEHEKLGAFGMFARMKLWDRPKESEVALANTEKRYEPFWMARAARRTSYIRKVVYRVKVEDAHVATVGLFDRKFPVDARRELQLPAVEECESTTSLVHYADALGHETPEKTLVDYAGRFPFQEIADSSEPRFIVPTLTAASVLQQVKSRLSAPVQADAITSDELDITSLTLFYRPVYAFQFTWKDKTGVIEIDGLSGRVNKEGNMLGGAVRRLGNRDTLFDLGADFAGIVVPGGTIVVKLIDKLSKKTIA